MARQILAYSGHVKMGFMCHSGGCGCCGCGCGCCGCCGCGGGRKRRSLQNLRIALANKLEGIAKIVRGTESDVAIASQNDDTNQNGVQVKKLIN
ncbi:unnamed protein product [Caenorhabditis bovis]|uniref:Uncharacterized protein n=1 Tax=Caenorhabditis bovis TaxID=2654633 RepID=A0A8S1ESI5_9PELO|nr:unnamed protein product [Caenorhabditis bovis]